MTIKLNGVIGQSFGGFICLRGDGKFGDLAAISKPDEGYQRESNNAHLKELTDFIKNSDNKYMPDVVLGLVLDNKSADNYDDRIYNKLAKLANGNFVDAIKDSLNNFAKITINKGKKNTPNIFVIEINKIEKFMYRIDGNHRLSVADNEVNISDGLRDLDVSFSIILFDGQFNYNIQAPIIFNNINLKHLPISQEENIKRVITSKQDGNYIYDTDTLTKEFGYNYQIIRALDDVKFSQNWLVDNIKTNPYTTKEVITRFISDGYKFSVDEFKNAIDIIIAKFSDCNNKLTQGVLACGIRVYLEGSKKIVLFKNWILTNGFLNLNISSCDIYDMFQEYLRKLNQTIFVSMPFSSKDHQVDINNLYDDIKTICQEINLEYGINLSIFKINEHEGSSIDISQEILKAIEDNGLLIANLTDGNKNVYHEIGYAMGIAGGEINKIIFLKSENFKDSVGFNIAKFQYVEYGSDSPQRKIKIKDTLKKYYKLS